MEKYYMVEIEEYWKKDDETPWRTEHYGLFRTYQDAVNYLLNEGFNVYAVKDELFGNDYEVYYEIKSEDGQQYDAWIKEWLVHE